MDRELFRGIKSKNQGRKMNKIVRTTLEKLAGDYRKASNNLERFKIDNEAHSFVIKVRYINGRDEIENYQDFYNQKKQNQLNLNYPRMGEI